MNEVKVFDSSGKLKEVISVEELNVRSEKQLEFPNLFLKNKKIRRPPGKSSENQASKI